MFSLNLNKIWYIVSKKKPWNIINKNFNVHFYLRFKKKSNSKEIDIYKISPSNLDIFIKMKFIPNIKIFLDGEFEIFFYRFD